MVLAWLAVGLVFGGLGAFELHETSQLQRYGTVTTAEVTYVRDGRNPILTAEYEAQGRGWESDTSRFTDEQVGDRVEILYDRTDPYRFQTQSWTGWTEDYAFAGVFLVAGAAAAVVGAVLGIRMLRPVRHRRRGPRWRGARGEALASAELVRTVGALLHRHDPIGLTARGASDLEEYQPEARTIVARLDGARSTADVRTVVHQEFVHWFDPDTAGPPARYELIARELWDLRSQWRHDVPRTG
ncbi:hypothetical protein [Aquipuribacter sp. MA13-6]|uniref:hypothetical protein n=1 Tax=unclassified Aquipuribacter TaxID=2635084 RepID=UPI003EEA359E